MGVEVSISSLLGSHRLGEHLGCQCRITRSEDVPGDEQAALTDFGRVEAGVTEIPETGLHSIEVRWVIQEKRGYFCITGVMQLCG